MCAPLVRRGAPKFAGGVKIGNLTEDNPHSGIVILRVGIDLVTARMQSKRRMIADAVEILTHLGL